jgi:hypothetical protein
MEGVDPPRSDAPAGPRCFLLRVIQADENDGKKKGVQMRFMCDPSDSSPSIALPRGNAPARRVEACETSACAPDLPSGLYADPILYRRG